MAQPLVTGVTRQAIAESLARARSLHFEAVQHATIALQQKESSLQRICGQHFGHLPANIDVGSVVQQSCAICGASADLDHPAVAIPELCSGASWPQVGSLVSLFEPPSTGSEIRSERLRLKLTQQRLGFLIGCGTSWIRAMERNVTTPSAHHKLRLVSLGMQARFLGTNWKPFSDPKGHAEAAAKTLREQGYTVVLP